MMSGEQREEIDNIVEEINKKLNGKQLFFYYYCDGRSVILEYKDGEGLIFSYTFTDILSCYTTLKIVSEIL